MDLEKAAYVEIKEEVYRAIYPLVAVQSEVSTVFHQNDVHFCWSYLHEIL